MVNFLDFFLDMTNLAIDPLVRLKYDIFQVEGRLPLLGIDLTDQVLESLLDIIAHIPLPETNPTQRVPTDPEALLKDVEFFDSKTGNLMPGHLKAMQLLRVASKVADRTASTSSDDQTEDGSDIFFDSSETPYTPAPNESAPQNTKTRKLLANLVMVKGSFIVEEIRIRLFEAAGVKNLSDPSAPMLVFAVNQIGADLTLRQWDQEINEEKRALSTLCSLTQNTWVCEKSAWHGLMEENRGKSMHHILSKIFKCLKEQRDIKNVVRQDLGGRGVSLVFLRRKTLPLE
ncbi:hypothetical protein ACTXT7_000332 [Hymenolepis weldensis]